MSSLIGQSLGRYHILEQLGEGGMAFPDLTCLIRAVTGESHRAEAAFVHQTFAETCQVFTGGQNG
jgi:hypothetical protein